jgi:hypothetical protein
MIVGSSRFPAPRCLASPCPASPMFIGALHVYPACPEERRELRRVVPVFAISPSPIVSLSPLNATLTKSVGDPLPSNSPVVAQPAAPSTPRLPILPGATTQGLLRCEPTPTVRLTSLNATLTKNEGVLVES